jgi:hypothetical protein
VSRIAFAGHPIWDFPHDAFAGNLTWDFPHDALRDISPGISRRMPCGTSHLGFPAPRAFCGTSQVYVTLVLVIRFSSGNKIRIPGISRKTPLRENSPGMSRKVGSDAGLDGRWRASTNYLSLNRASSCYVAYAKVLKGQRGALAA